MDIHDHRFPWRSQTPFAPIYIKCFNVFHSVSCTVFPPKHDQTVPCFPKDRNSRYAGTCRNHVCQHVEPPPITPGVLGQNERDYNNIMGVCMPLFLHISQENVLKTWVGYCSSISPKAAIVPNSQQLRPCNLQVTILPAYLRHFYHEFFLAEPGSVTSSAAPPRSRTATSPSHGLGGATRPCHCAWRRPQWRPPGMGWMDGK